MSEKLNLIIWTIVLMLITIVITMQLIEAEFLLIILALIMPFAVMPIYKKCLNRRMKSYKHTFWNSYWYDMKCKLVVIPFILAGAGAYVWVIDYVS